MRTHPAQCDQIRRREISPLLHPNGYHRFGQTISLQYKIWIALQSVWKWHKLPSWGTNNSHITAFTTICSQNHWALYSCLVQSSVITSFRPMRLPFSHPTPTLCKLEIYLHPSLRRWACWYWNEVCVLLAHLEMGDSDCAIEQQKPGLNTMGSIQTI